MRLKKGSRTALVLAGGGITGAVYEIGALRAIDDLLIDRSVNDFDIYVGTSAGALVSSFLVNGISPETQLEVMSG
jgi:predicted acylesterase/phospholipase RssA